MADMKTSALNALTGAGLASGDKIPVDDVSATELKSITAAELAIGLQAIGFGTSSNFLTSDVTMTTAGTYYDGPTLTPAAGTYLLLGHVLMIAVTSAVRLFQGKLWDGTTVISNDALEVPGTAAAGQGPLVFFGVVTTDGTKTYKISCTSSVNSDHISNNSSKGSYLYALKIG